MSAPSWQPQEARHLLRRHELRKAVRIAMRDGYGVYMFTPDIPPAQARRELHASAMHLGAQVSLHLSPLELADGRRAYRIRYCGPLQAVTGAAA